MSLRRSGLRRAMWVAAGFLSLLVLQLAGSASAGGTRSGAWSTVVPIAAPSEGLAAAASGGTVFAMGGDDVDGTVLPFNRRYALATNTWSSAAPMPAERMRPRLVTGADGKIYVFGGNRDNGIVDTAVDVYDPSTNSWTTPTTLPEATGPPANVHQGSGAFALGGDGRIYAIGGCCNQSGVLHDVEAYDPVANSWTPAAPVPIASSQQLAATGQDGRIYVIGGAVNGPPGITNAVQIYDPKTDSWSVGAPAPFPHPLADDEAVATGHDGLIYLLGAPDALNRPSGVVSFYDPASDSWSSVVSCPSMTPRFDFGAATGSDGRIYAIGGASGLNLLTTVEALTPGSAGGGSLTVSPDFIGQGAVSSVTIAGAGFQPGATISICPGGVSALSTSVPGSTKVKAMLKADPDAAVGPRNVTITNPDGSSSSCAACLSVDPAPVPTATVPGGAAPGDVRDVTIVGTGFQSGATVKIGCPPIVCISGVAVNSTTYVDSRHLVVNVTVTLGAASGSRTVAVVNPDGGKGSCSCFMIFNQAKVLFQTNRDGNYEIYSANANGTGQTDLTNTLDSESAFRNFGDTQPSSLDGAKIAFVEDAHYGPTVNVMNANGSGQFSVVPGTAPSWSPNGARLLYDCASDVCVVNTDRSGQVNLTNRESSPDLFEPAYAPDGWSPDGSLILLDGLHGTPGNWDVYTVRPDGTGLTAITSGQCDQTDAKWSPDGSRIVFVRKCPGGAEDIWTMNPDGSGQAQLTSYTGLDDEPTWSPDGSKIAFVSDRNGNHDIWTMSADGSNKLRLTSSAQPDDWPQWSPDGTMIAYETHRWCLKDDNREVYVMNSKGNAQTDVSTNCAEDLAPSWQR
jgi:Tol biopolymer transport system component